MLKVIRHMKEAVKFKPVKLCLLWYRMQGNTEDYSGKTQQYPHKEIWTDGTHTWKLHD